MSRPKNADSVLVYSTDGGRTCPDCGRPVAACACGQAKAAPTGDGVVRVSRQTKGRKGKGVTLVTGLALEPAALAALARELKQKCGAGGTVVQGVVEIQGDHRQAVKAELERRGFKPKLAGG